MPTLHIVQGNADQDRRRLEATVIGGPIVRTWVVPKSAVPGDDVVIFIGGYGFYATARVRSKASARGDWTGRYAAAIEAIRLIEPAISLGTIRHRVPELTWGIYPRGITTPDREVSDRVKLLIEERRKTGLPDINDKALSVAGLDELRRVALMRASSTVSRRERKIIAHARSQAIRRYVLSRANGCCEGCGTQGPFRTADGGFYLEPHHTRRLADDGPDHPSHVIGLCPNCHRRAHYAIDRTAFNGTLLKRLSRLEAKHG